MPPVARVVNSDQMINQIRHFVGDYNWLNTSVELNFAPLVPLSDLVVVDAQRPRIEVISTQSAFKHREVVLHRLYAACVSHLIT